MFFYFVRHRSGYLNEDPVGAQLHDDLDAYDSFCIAIPLEQLARIIETLHESNRDWNDRAESDPQAFRGLDVR